MAAENRLTAEQLAELTPGDIGTIESGLEFGRRRYTTGKVGRVVGRHILVTSEGVRGGKFLERFDARDGVRVGGGTRAELVNVQPDEPASWDLLLRQARHIDVLYRAWSRGGGPVPLRLLEHAGETATVRTLVDQVDLFAQRLAAAVPPGVTATGDDPPPEDADSEDA